MVAAASLPRGGFGGGASSPQAEEVLGSAWRVSTQQGHGDDWCGLSCLWFSHVVADSVCSLHRHPVDLREMEKLVPQKAAPVSPRRALKGQLRKCLSWVNLRCCGLVTYALDKLKLGAESMSSVLRSIIL